MFKKLISCLAVFATMSFAAWDNVPILQQGSGQVAAKIGYTSQDPLSGVVVAAGVRYSALSWLELSAMVPFGFYSYSYQGQSQDYNGLMNAQVGLRFQISQGFSLFVDGHMPGSIEVSDDQFAVEFGLQHSNLFSSVTWAKYIGYVLGDPWTNQYLYFGTELQILLNHFIICGEFRVLMGQENAHYCSGYSCDDEGGDNGFLFGLGVKIDLTEKVTLDLGVEIGGGDRFTKGGLDSPLAFGATLFYNF
jgi:opacity protein-like surface antigen